MNDYAEQIAEIEKRIAELKAKLSDIDSIESKIADALSRTNLTLKIDPQRIARVIAEETKRSVAGAYAARLPKGLIGTVLVSADGIARFSYRGRTLGFWTNPDGTATIRDEGVTS